jgi:outer membrane protein OmpA-like peptidoglycan-associated protein
MPAKPMLDGIELQLVQDIEAEDEEALAQHSVLALEGDFLQDLGRRASRISLTGVMIGEEVADALKKLRDKFRAAEPVSFVADIATATKVDKVLIEELGVRDLAGKPDRFEYALTLREFIPPPPTEREEPPPPPPPPPPPAVETGTLVVEVIVEGEPNFDFSKVTVTVEGTQDNGTALSRTLTNRSNNVWTEENFPPGQYTARAVVTDPPMSGVKQATVRAGQTAQVQITLRTGAVIAKAFVIHFWFDRAFIEPCMRHVLRQVASHAQTHPDEKPVIVGHTDLTGPDEYNQSLSERRARSAFAHLTFGRDRATALAEWDQLRRQRTPGIQRSINDSWGPREYQSMLQDLGFYSGNINERHDAATDAAVRAFQQDKGLNADGIVGDQTWLALIDAYLSQDNLAAPENQFLPNASNGCDGGILKWLGCGEMDPVRDTQDAWRPNRRTEILFVKEDSLPAKVRKPDTFELPPPAGAGPTWCLGDSSVITHCCFVKPHVTPRKETCPEPSDREPWTRVPAEPGTVIVHGSIKFEDGTPAANSRYVLIAPDGEFLHKNLAGEADLGEVPSGEKRGRPVLPPNRTDANGEFSYPSQTFAGRETTTGVYTLEILEPLVGRLKGEPIDAAKGNVVCKRLDGTSNFDVIVVAQVVVQVRPSIVLATSIVVVKKPHTNPMRQPVTLRANVPFTGTGTFTRSKDNIRFFTALVGGAEITFDGVDNVFTAAQLVAGHIIHGEGAAPSAGINDAELTLALTVNGQAGFADHVTMTAVELTLDVALSRTVLGVDPPVMPANDKIIIGRHVQVNEPGFSHERAVLIVRQPNPVAFTGTLLLGLLNAKAQAFDAEVPAGGQAAIPNPRAVPSGGIPVDGLRFFAEGRTVSTAVRDTGFQLGIQGLENDGDRVPMTAVQIEVADTDAAAAPAVTFARFGLWDNAFRAPGDPAGILFNSEAEADNFCGADSRRLHIRVRDVSAGGSPHIQIDWLTRDPNNNNLDAPANRDITLVEAPVNPGIFVSRGLLLVTDTDDRNQATHAGMPAGFPDAVAIQGINGRNHRVRRGNLRGDMRVEYRRVAGVNLPLQLPVFQRNPESRRRLPLQLFVLRVAPGGAGVIPTAPGGLIWTRDLRVAEECYARIGIEVETLVAPGTPAGDIQEERPFIQNEGVPTSGPRASTLVRSPVIKDARNRIEVRLSGGGSRMLTILYDDNPNVPGSGEVKIDRATGRLTFKADEQPTAQDGIVASYVVVGHRTVLINVPAGVNPANISFADETAIGSAHPALADTIRVFFVGGLASGNGGETWTDAITTAADSRRGAVFTIQATGPYAAAHEVGHALTNKDAAASACDPAPAARSHFCAPAVPPGNRLHNDQNLMKRQFLGAERVDGPKRIWDANDADALNQFTAMRASHYTRNF